MRQHKGDEASEGGQDRTGGQGIVTGMLQQEVGEGYEEVVRQERGLPAQPMRWHKGGEVGGDESGKGEQGGMRGMNEAG